MPTSYLISPTYNRFQSSKVYGSFQNSNDTVNNILATATFDGSVNIIGCLTTPNVKDINQSVLSLNTKCQNLQWDTYYGYTNVNGSMAVYGKFQLPNFTDVNSTLSSLNTNCGRFLYDSGYDYTNCISNFTVYCEKYL